MQLLNVVHANLGPAVFVYVVDWQKKTRRQTSAATTQKKSSAKESMGGDGLRGARCVWKEKKNVKVFHILPLTLPPEAASRKVA